ncbi:uncharacterized protein [Penaeus vannamei]|uniref:uncharacterized protein n=1 Tax=Penaeus vannamei TaxID=6689 RepID=UPI00387F9843
MGEAHYRRLEPQPPMRTRNISVYGVYTIPTQEADKHLSRIGLNCDPVDDSGEQLRRPTQSQHHVEKSKVSRGGAAQCTSSSVNRGLPRPAGYKYSLGRRATGRASVRGSSLFRGGRPCEVAFGGGRARSGLGNGGCGGGSRVKRTSTLSQLSQCNTYGFINYMNSLIKYCNLQFPGQRQVLISAQHSCEREESRDAVGQKREHDSPRPRSEDTAALGTSPPAGKRQDITIFRAASPQDIAAHRTPSNLKSCEKDVMRVVCT